MILRFKIMKTERLNPLHQSFILSLFLLISTILNSVQSEQINHHYYNQDFELNETLGKNVTAQHEETSEAFKNGLNYGYFHPNFGFYSCPNNNYHNPHPLSSCHFVDPNSNERENIMYKRQLFQPFSPFGFPHNNNNPNQILVIEGPLIPPPMPEFEIGIGSGNPSISNIPGISDKSDIARLVKGTGVFECDFQSQPQSNQLPSQSQNRQRFRPSSSPSSTTTRQIQGIGSYACYFKGIRRLSESFLHGLGGFACNFTRISDPAQIKMAQKVLKEQKQNQNPNLNVSMPVSAEEIKLSTPQIFQGSGPYQCSFSLPDGSSEGPGGGLRGLGGLRGGLGQLLRLETDPTDDEQFLPPPALLFRPNLEQVVLPNVKQKEGFIQGTGQFQCIVQGAFLGFKIIESVGYYRCIFRGARKTRGFIEGIGYFQLIYQKAQELQTFFQMVGHYQCNFQGVRHYHGFVSSMGHPIGELLAPGPLPSPVPGQFFPGQGPGLPPQLVPEPIPGEIPVPEEEIRIDLNDENDNNNTSGSIPPPPAVPIPAPPQPILPIIPLGIAAKTAYLDFLFEYFSGLGDSDVRNGQPGSLQLLGNYQHDIDGLHQHPNFGSMQLLELYNLELDLVDLGSDDQTNFGQRDYASQVGQIRYSFQDGNPNNPVPFLKGSDLLQLTGQLGYNFQLQSNKDEKFFLYLGRYDYHSDGPDVPLDPDHDHDFIQGVGSYSLMYPPSGPNDTKMTQSHVQTIITYQYDHARAVADFLQIVALFEQNYPGFDPEDVMYLKLLATYQKGFFGGTSEEFVQFIGIFTYSLQGMGTDAGFFQLYTFYDDLLKHTQDSNGYVQMLLQYAFNYEGPGENIGTLQIQLQYQYNFPEFPAISNVQANQGYFQILGKFKIDLQWMKIDKVPSYLQVVVIFQCNVVDGSMLLDYMCFTQVYCIYQSDLMGLGYNPNAYGRIVGQYYGEL